MPISDTNRILNLAQEGDRAAIESLMERYRDRLRRMISIFLDPRISMRVDSSDVLQETLTNAAKRLPKYLETRPVAFYPWLRAIARDELVKVHRRHMGAQRRSIHCEQPLGEDVSDASAQLLANRLVSSETSPSQKADANDLREQVKIALRELEESDREILLMRCVEQLSLKEVMATIGVSESAAKSRLSRAIRKLGNVLRTNK